jgi:hypothetical protein
VTEQPLDAGGGDDQSAKLHARAAAVALVTVDSRRALEQGCPPPVVTAVAAEQVFEGHPVDCSAGIEAEVVDAASTSRVERRQMSTARRMPSTWGA